MENAQKAYLRYCPVCCDDFYSIHCNALYCCLCHDSSPGHKPQGRIHQQQAEGDAHFLASWMGSEYTDGGIEEIEAKITLDRLIRRYITFRMRVKSQRRWAEPMHALLYLLSIGLDQSDSAQVLGISKQRASQAFDEAQRFFLRVTGSRYRGATPSLPERVQAALRHTRSGVGIPSLVRYLNRTRPAGVRRVHPRAVTGVVCGMCRSGRLVRVGRGKYRLPNRKEKTGNA